MNFIKYKLNRCALDKDAYLGSKSGIPYFEDLRAFWVEFRYFVKLDIKYGNPI